MISYNLIVMKMYISPIMHMYFKFSSYLFRESISKETSPAPFSKEGSPAPFNKESSPTRFVTGRPIDQGANANKIKKLERSLSGKVTYDDLEEARNQLPTYLQTIESISDVTVLQTMVHVAFFLAKFQTCRFLLDFMMMFFF